MPTTCQYRADLAYAWMRMGDVRRAQGRVAEALAWHQKALAVAASAPAPTARSCSCRGSCPRSLNAVGELLLEMSPATARKRAACSMKRARSPKTTLVRAPSFNEVRKQLATSQEGLARTALSDPRRRAEARDLLMQSAATWREVFTRSVGDERQVSRLAEVERLVAALSASVP